MRPADRVQTCEFMRNPRLLLIVLSAGEHEVVAGDRRLAGENGPPSRDRVEGVDGERRRPVRRGPEVRVQTQRRSRPDARILVDTVRPDDLLGQAQSPRLRRVRKFDARHASRRFGELAPAHFEDAAASPYLLFFFGEREGTIAPVLRDVRDLARLDVEGEFISVPRVPHRLL